MYIDVENIHTFVHKYIYTCEIIEVIKLSHA